ncbi:MAG: hypothetical protein H0W61_03435 [Bacteroidetes bacterium]|nr:hypothetical protein [Bacteroidota bacterium]
MNNNLLRLLFVFTLYSSPFFCSNKQPVCPNPASDLTSSVEYFIYSQKSLSADSIIISVNTNDPASISDVKQFLKNLPGVNGAYYCDNHGVFIVFENLPQDSPPLTDLLKKKYPAYVIEAKSGSVKELMNFCSFNDPADMAGLKAN